MWRIPLTNGLRVPMLVLLAAWMVLLAILGFTRLIPVAASDRALHFVGFGTMSVLVFFSFQATVPRRKVWTLTGGAMATACFFSEVLQWMLTTRVFEWSDIVCNFLGAATFLFAAWMADRWIIQPRVAAIGHGGQSAHRYRDSTRYWALDAADADAAADGDNGGGSLRDSLDDLDVELDEILVDSPHQIPGAVPPSRR
ncbi:hypothetical protein H4S06_006232 [Coemansia sp. BCRC 34490]|nr:hypothetical protein H4S06_006232 [Coemansia sp. BCRC 34490]